jgi:hypothetical protein
MSKEEFWYAVFLAAILGKTAAGNQMLSPTMIASEARAIADASVEVADATFIPSED